MLSIVPLLKGVQLAVEQELGAADSLHCYVVDEEWCTTGLAPPEFDNDLLGFVDVQG